MYSQIRQGATLNTTTNLGMFLQLDMHQAQRTHKDKKGKRHQPHKIPSLIYKTILSKIFRKLICPQHHVKFHTELSHPQCYHCHYHCH